MTTELPVIDSSVLCRGGWMACEACAPLVPGLSARGPHCPLCLGVRPRLAALADELAAAVAACGFEAPTVALRVRLPARVELTDAVAAAVRGDKSGAAGALRESVAGGVQAQLASRGVSARRFREGVAAAPAAEEFVAELVLEEDAGSRSAAEALARELLGEDEVRQLLRSARKRQRSGGMGGRGGDSSSSSSWAAAGALPLDETTMNLCRARARKLGVLEARQLLQRLALDVSVSEPARASLRCSRESVYVTGRYVKLARGLSHTPWAVDGERRGEGSVEELLLQGATAALPGGYSSCRFHSAGREDMDVRMLGEGRPFVLELLDAPRLPRPEALEALRAAVNSDALERLSVGPLLVEGKEAMVRLDQGARSKRKQYTCVVWSADKLRAGDLLKLDALKDVELSQQTPLRVMHRRSALDRAKTIYSCSCEFINSHFFILRLEASAGTYIKEFVHGDLGRTQPNVRSILGCSDADIIQLDVEKVIIDGELEELGPEGRGDEDE